MRVPGVAAAAGGEAGDPWVLAGCAGVGDGGAVGSGDRDAPAGSWVAGGGAGDVAGLVGVEQAVRAGVGGGGGPAEQGAGRDEEVDQRRDWRAVRGRAWVCVRAWACFWFSSGVWLRGGFWGWSWSGPQTGGRSGGRACRAGEVERVAALGELGQDA